MRHGGEKSGARGTMRIASVRWSLVRIPFRAPYETAHGVATQRSAVILRLHTDAGLQGLGEASLDPNALEQEVPWLVDELVGMAERVVGLPHDAAGGALDYAEMVAGEAATRAAFAAIDTALVDLAARAAGLPAARYLQASDDGSQPEAVPRGVAVNATIAAAGLTPARDAAKRAVDAGFGCVKLKVGIEQEPARELRRVQAVKQALPDGVKLRLDANGAWAEAAAIEIIGALAPLDIELDEQPTSPEDTSALRRVREAVTTPLAADEGADSLDAALRVLSADAADIIVLKPARIGGPRACLVLPRVAAFAAGFLVTTTIDTGVGTAAALQVAASLPGQRYAHGLATASLLEHDLLRAALPIERGFMRLPDAPGLGVELDEAALARYTVAEGHLP